MFACSFFVDAGEREELAKVEELGNYFRCLYRRELESMIKEEETLRSNLGFKKMTDKQLKKLRGALINQSMGRAAAEKRLQEKGIVELPSYDLLCNPEYADKFLYVPIVNRIEGQDYSASTEVRRYLYNHFHCEEEEKKDIEAGDLKKKR